MPVTWTIEGATLRLAMEGSYDFGDVIAAIRAAFVDPRFHAGMPLVLDERRSSANPSGLEKRARVASIASLRPNIGERVTLVTSTDPSRYGLARMAAAFFEMEGMAADVLTDPNDIEGLFA